MSRSCFFVLQSRLVWKEEGFTGSASAATRLTSTSHICWSMLSQITFLGCNSNVPTVMVWEGQGAQLIVMSMKSIRKSTWCTKGTQLTLNGQWMLKICKRKFIHIIQILQHYIFKFEYQLKVCLIFSLHFLYQIVLKHVFNFQRHEQIQLPKKEIRLFKIISCQLLKRESRNGSVFFVGRSPS